MLRSNFVMLYIYSVPTLNDSRILQLELPNGEPIAASSQEKSINKQPPMCLRTGLFSATVSGPFCEWPLCFLLSFSYRILNFEDFINARDAMTQILDEETKPINVRKNLNQRIKARRNVKDSEWGKQRKREIEKEESREVEDIFSLS